MMIQGCKRSLTETSTTNDLSTYGQKVQLCACWIFEINAKFIRSKILGHSNNSYYVFQIKWQIKTSVFSPHSIYEFCVILVINIDHYVDQN